MIKEQIIPVIGMGATICLWSDRHAATIVDVPNSKTVVIQQDKSTILKGSEHDGSAEYGYAPNPYAPKETFTLRKTGRWVLKGESLTGQKLAIGHRVEYRDPCF